VNYSDKRRGNDIGDGDNVNMQTPTRGHVYNSNTPNSNNASSFMEDDTNKPLDAVRNLNFDQFSIGSTADISCNESEIENRLPHTKYNVTSTPPSRTEEYKGKNGESKTLIPQTDTSPESDVLKQSEHSAIKARAIPNSLNKRDKSDNGLYSGGERRALSPTAERSDSDFARRLIAYNGVDDTFIDDDNTAIHTNTSNNITNNIDNYNSNKSGNVTTIKKDSNKDVNMKSSNSDNNIKIENLSEHTKLLSTPQSHVKEDNSIASTNNILGDEWKEAETPQGKKYYYNRRTRESHWKYV
jgi:hypothetical protein